jgi:hypothetical protein
MSSSRRRGNPRKESEIRSKGRLLPVSPSPTPNSGAQTEVETYIVKTPKSSHNGSTDKQATNRVEVVLTFPCTN